MGMLMCFLAGQHGSLRMGCKRKIMFEIGKETCGNDVRILYSIDYHELCV